MTVGASGMDLYAAIDAPITLQPGQRVLIPNGIAVSLSVGYEAQVRSRSGLALKYGVTLLNSPGTIDSDYKGCIGSIMINLGELSYTINPGDRVSQLVLSKIEPVEFIEVEELIASNGDRGSNGYGSTGI